MAIVIFGAPVIEDLNKTQHNKYHGFVIVDGVLMTAPEFSRKLVTLADNTTITFVAIHDTQGVYKKVDWAVGLTGDQIKQKLEVENSLVAFTCDLQFIAKPTSTVDKALSFVVGLLGDKAIFADSQANDRIELDFNLNRACFLLDIVVDA
jgi:hypothetical protein